MPIVDLSRTLLGKQTLSHKSFLFVTTESYAHLWANHEQRGIRITDPVKGLVSWAWRIDLFFLKSRFLPNTKPGCWQKQKGAEKKWQVGPEIKVVL